MSTKWAKRSGKGTRGPGRDEQRKGGFSAENARCWGLKKHRVEVAVVGGWAGGTERAGQEPAERVWSISLSPWRAVKDSVMGRTWSYPHFVFRIIPGCCVEVEEELQGWEIRRYIRSPLPESRPDIMRALGKGVETSMMHSLGRQWIMFQITPKASSDSLLKDFLWQKEDAWPACRVWRCWER